MGLGFEGVGDDGEPVFVVGRDGVDEFARVVQQFVGEFAAELFEQVRRVLAVGEATVGFLQELFADGVGVFPHFAHDLLLRLGAQPADEVVAVEVDDGFCLACRALPGFEVVVDDLFEVVHAVEEGLVQGVDGGVEVARDGEVDEDLQGVAPPFEGFFEVFARDEHVVAARRADDDVGFVQLCGQLFEADGEAAVRFGQGLGVREGAVGDDEALDVVVFQVFGDELRGFARADDECGAAVVVVKEAVGEFDAGGGDGDVVGADLGAVADLFGDGEALLEEALQHAADGARFFAEVVGLFELAEDLRLAEDEGVKAAGDAVDVADGVAVVHLEGERGEGCGVEVFVGGKPGSNVRAVATDGIEFAAIAGGEQGDFVHAGLPTAVGKGGGGFCGAEGDFFAHGGVGGVMVDAVGSYGFYGFVKGGQHMVMIFLVLLF